MHAPNLANPQNLIDLPARVHSALEHSRILPSHRHSKNAWANGILGRSGSQERWRIPPEKISASSNARTEGGALRCSACSGSTVVRVLRCG